MSTSFNEPFEQFLLIIDDSRFLNNYTTDTLVLELFKYLCRSIGICEDYLYKDLTLYTPTQQQSQSFIGSGSSGVFTLTITPYINGNFYVSVDDIEVEATNYTYNSVAKTITITPIPVLNSEIYIGNYIVGEFTDTLTIQEIGFTARGMTIPYLEFQLQKNKHLNQIIYGRDYQVHSQAQHIKENRDTIMTTKESLIQDMILYSYHKDPDNLEGSSGAYV